MIEEYSDKFNPFNSQKHFSQIYRWKEVGKQPSPAPASISLDPSNLCQLKCIWCNSKYIQSLNQKKIIEREDLMKIADHLPQFTNHPRYGNVEAVCIAGGGEPLTNPAIEELVDRLLKNNIKSGLITNGILLNEFNATNCEWVGVSIDAGTKETYKQLKGGDYFGRVIKNVENLVKTEGIISKPGKAHGVTYKFVMHPYNIDDIYEAAKIAKDIGCRAFHLRPFGVPYKSHGKEFTKNDIDKFQYQLLKARALEDDNFRVYGITHKFKGDFTIDNNFKKCYAIAFSCTIQPPTKNNFNAVLCCDQRGDKNLTLENITTKELKEFWGSEKHLSLIDKINPKKCPRCTRGPHNYTYEKTIREENLGYEFG